MAWLEARRPEMLALTEELVNIDGGTYDKAGVDAVGRRLEQFLEAQGIPCEWIPVEKHGDALRATVNAGANGRPIILMGHRDTVFPKGEPSRRPFSISGDRAYGPGVADMKAGLVQNAFILAAFNALGGAPAPLVGLFTGDEEIGSPTSRPIIEETARGARAVFNSEPGRASGNVVTSRRGGVFFTCEVFGRAAHSGNSFQEGRSAIAEIARKITAWFAINDAHSLDSVTINVGLVSGGEAVNMVAPYAACGIDLRYTRPEDRDPLVAEITRIAEDCRVGGTSAQLRIDGEFLPVAESPSGQALFEHYVAAAADVGFSVGGEFTGSCADSGFTAALGVPTLCAMGPVGGKAHSHDEYMEIDTVVPRAQAVALAVARLTPEA